MDEGCCFMTNCDHGNTLTNVHRPFALCIYKCMHSLNMNQFERRASAGVFLRPSLDFMRSEAALYDPESDTVPSACSLCPLHSSCGTAAELCKY